MSDNHTSHGQTKLYITIFVALGILTLIELWIPAIEILNQFQKGGFLILVALIKAFLVGYYFMHLKFEKAWLKFISLIPISAALYAAVLILETKYR
jgi:cytochrome c oxidase subunit 4